MGSKRAYIAVSKDECHGVYKRLYGPCAVRQHASWCEVGPRVALTSNNQESEDAHHGPAVIHHYGVSLNG